MRSKCTNAVFNAMNDLYPVLFLQEAHVNKFTKDEFLV